MNKELYTVVGKGRQGTVLKLSEQACVKIYNDKEYALRESSSYQLAKGSFMIPKLYEVGPNYLIMEYIQGPSLQDYLAIKGYISKSITVKILSALSEMKQLGFTRIDAALFHFLVTKDGDLKVIDLVNSYSKVERIPVVMLKGLRKLGLLDSFMQQVKELDPNLYMEWSGK